MVGQEVDMSALLTAYVERGHEDTSAEPISLTFKALLTGYTSDSLFLKLDFGKPLSLSIGNKPDKLIISFRETDLFVSAESGKSLKRGTSIEMLIPKQFPDQASFELAVVTGSTV